MKGSGYLVDSGYPNRIGYLAPFKGSTYHIPEFHHHSGPPKGTMRCSISCISLRSVIERAFRVYKEKWCILMGIPSFSTRTQKQIIIAYLALHNFIRDSNLRDKEFERCDANEEYLVQQISDTTQTQGDESEDMENEESMNIIRARITDALVSVRGGCYILG